MPAFEHTLIYYLYLLTYLLTTYGLTALEREMSTLPSAYALVNCGTLYLYLLW